MKIEVRKLQNTDIEELSRIEAASFSMPWLAEDFRGLLTRDYCLYVVHRPSACMRNSVLSPRGSARNFMKNRQRMP